MKKRISWAIAVGSIFVFSSCAVQQYHQNEPLKVDESGFADDLAGKFTVTDTQEASKAAMAATQAKVQTEEKSSAALKGKKGKKGKKKGKEAAEPSAVAATVPTPATAAPAPAAPKLPVAKNGKRGAGESDFKVRRVGKLPFSPGERTMMTITYFGVEAGTLDLRVMPYKYIGGRKAIHIRGQGLSTSVFALFYRVNDVGEAFMDYDGLFSHKFQLKVDESKQIRDLVELYDQKNHQIHFWEKMVHGVKGLRITEFTKPISEFAQDAVTAAFYLRTLPLEVGREFSFPMVTNGQEWIITAKVLRRENLVTPLGTIPALVVEPETRFEGVLKSTGRSFIWVSDDEHHNFLKIDAKVKVGSVAVYLRELQQGAPDAE